MFDIVLENQRAEHRRKRQCDEPGNHHRARQCQRELNEQPTGAPGRKRKRRIYGGKGQRHGNHRERNLARAGDGRFEARNAGLHIAIDIFQHHDGVIDHQANGQHHRQQCQRVDAEIEHVHQRAGTDQRYRNGDQRNDGGAQIPQEQENHQRNQQDRIPDSAKHGFDGLFDKQGRIENHLKLHSGRQIFLDLGRLRAYRQ